MILTRRAALALLPSMPLAVSALAQSPAPRVRRFITGKGGYYVIEPDGRVKAWASGQNVKRMEFGLGDEAIVPRYAAQEIATLRGAMTIASGEAEYALMGDGRVLSWGSNAYGIRGTTPFAEFETNPEPRPPLPMPTPTLPMPTVVDIAAMTQHVVALTADGSVFTWGNGRAGQLGIGDMPVINFKTRLPEAAMYIPYPNRVPDLSNAVAVSAGSRHSLALLTDGTIRGWGANEYGQIGDGTTVQRLRPVAVSGITNAVAVAAGAEYSLALLSNGTVMGWGWGNGAIARNGATRQRPNPTPQLIAGAVGLTAIAAGGAHALGLTTAGTVISWGTENVYRPVGHSNPTVPAPATGITTARAISAGALSSQAVLADGTIMVWGVLPSLIYRLDGGTADGSSFPVPMVVKGL